MSGDFSLSCFLVFGFWRRLLASWFLAFGDVGLLRVSSFCQRLACVLQERLEHLEQFTIYRLQNGEVLLL